MPMWRSHVDLLIGVVPIVNLEWIQKIFRDCEQRGYSTEAVTDTILRRMHDYVHYITPQFSRTDINFQRVPTVDTSNPFIARDIPTPDESFVVIRFKDPKQLQVDFPYLLNMLKDSFMSTAQHHCGTGRQDGLCDGNHPGTDHRKHAGCPQRLTATLPGGAEGLPRHPHLTGIWQSHLA